MKLNRFYDTFFVGFFYGGQREAWWRDCKVRENIHSRHHKEDPQNWHAVFVFSQSINVISKYVKPKCSDCKLRLVLLSSLTMSLAIPCYLSTLQCLSVCLSVLPWEAIKQCLNSFLAGSTLIFIFWTPLCWPSLPPLRKEVPNYTLLTAQVKQKIWVYAGNRDQNHLNMGCLWIIPSNLPAGSPVCFCSDQVSTQYGKWNFGK